MVAKNRPRPPRGAAQVSDGPTESALPSCLISMTLRRPGQSRMYPSMFITPEKMAILVRGEKDQTELPVWSFNKNSHSEKECKTSYWMIPKY